MNKQHILDEILLESGLGEFDGIRVNDLSQVTKGYKGLVLLVNDHGNVSLYEAFKNGNFHLIVDRV